MGSFERTVRYGQYFEGQGSTGQSVAQGTSAKNSPAANPSGVSASVDTSGVAEQVKGNSLIWWLGLAAIFIATTFAIEKFDTGSTFGNVKLSFYNVVVIGLNAVLFIALAKAFALKVKVPGLSAVLLAI